VRREDKMYHQEYGQIPDNQQDRIKLILGKRAKNEKYLKSIAKAARELKAIKWHKLSFTLWKVVRPSARARARRAGGFINMYVPRAAEAKEWFMEYAKENNLPYIDTPCVLNIKIYEKTPSHFNMEKKILAEMGLIKPWKRTGDFDNYSKSVADFMQGSVLKDDCLVIGSTVDLFYSIKPHAEIEILYMELMPYY